MWRAKIAIHRATDFVFYILLRYPRSQRNDPVNFSLAFCGWWIRRPYGQDTLDFHESSNARFSLLGSFRASSCQRVYFVLSFFFLFFFFFFYFIFSFFLDRVQCAVWNIVTAKTAQRVHFYVIYVVTWIRASRFCGKARGFQRWKYNVLMVSIRVCNFVINVECFEYYFFGSFIVKSFSTLRFKHVVNKWKKVFVQ